MGTKEEKRLREIKCKQCGNPTYNETYEYSGFCSLKCKNNYKNSTKQKLQRIQNKLYNR